MTFWNFKNLSDAAAELRISGDIVDDDVSWFYDWLDIPHAAPNAFRQALKEHAGKALTVWIDTAGGSVFAASGIYNALKEHKGHVTVKVDGQALSAGSIIAMAGDEVLMGPVSMMMIHNPWFRAAGDANEFRHHAEVLDQVKEAIINAYETKTGLNRDELWKLMDEETWMNARRAVELGFANGILYQEDADPEPAAMSAFAFSRLAIQNKATASMRRFFDVAAAAHGDAPPELALQIELMKLKEVPE